MSSKTGKRAVTRNESKVSKKLQGIYEVQLYDIVDASKFLLSDLKPSDWAEQHRSMGSDESPVPGSFSFAYTPYLKEVVDCLSNNHACRVCAVMKGAQIGFSTGVIENGIGWIIAQNPGNILFLSGHQELSEEAMNGKIDKMIDSCGLRHLIKPNVQRKRNQRTGDTQKAKEFPGGSLTAGSASNHKLLKQRSVQFGFIDDFDGAKKSSTDSGDTTTLIEQRFAAYYDKMKLFLISTPELKESSNIEPAYLLGDQRRFKVSCPCCGEFIFLFWTVPIEGKVDEMGGITWKLDEKGDLLEESVGYTCQKCGEWFNDSRKTQMLASGFWEPTAEPSEIGYYSYHISCLYSPPGMRDWASYVRQYLKANPPGGKRDEKKHQTFVNLALGETYETTGEAPEAKILQANIRSYEIGIVPESYSIKDGNGRIVILTMSCDLNGVEDDARLDYEILAWSESGATYSIRHGSIGTFVPMEGRMKNKEDRTHWTYVHNQRNSVWPELKKIIESVFKTDTPNPTAQDRFNIGRVMKIVLTGIDTGHYTTHAYAFIDANKGKVVGVRGDKESKFRKYDADTPSFKPARERGELYMLDVNHIKNTLANLMNLPWNAGNDDEQPSGFMNYPTPSGGLYLFNNYFSHFEAEHKVAVKSKTDGSLSYRWVKKGSGVQNHCWDLRVYQIALRDIIVDLVAKELKLKKLSWPDFCRYVLPK